MEITRLEHLATKSGWENYWKSIYPFVAPKTMYLSDSQDECFEYVPILETIKAVAGVRKLFGEFKESCSTLLKDISDGSYFKEHSIFRNASTKG